MTSTAEKIARVLATRPADMRPLDEQKHWETDEWPASDHVHGSKTVTGHHNLDGTLRVSSVVVARVGEFYTPPAPKRRSQRAVRAADQRETDLVVRDAEKVGLATRHTAQAILRAEQAQADAPVQIDRARANRAMRDHLRRAGAA